MRRIAIIVLLLAIIGGAVAMLLRWDPIAARTADPWRAVPAEAVAVIEVPDALAAWDRFTHTSLLWRAWEPLPGARRLAGMAARAGRLLENDAALREALGRPAVLVAFLRAGEGSVDAVFLGAAGRAAPERMAVLLGVAEPQAGDFASGRPVPCTADSVSQGLHACLREGLWMLSGSASALEEAMLQLERGEPLAADTLFARARATLGRASEAHLLIRTKRAMDILQGTWEPRRIERLALPDGWLALDAAPEPDALLLGGLLVPAQGHEPLVSSLGQQGTGPWDIARLLPMEAVQWEVRHVGDARAAREQLEEKDRGAEAVADWMRGSVGVARGLAPDRRWLVAEAEDPERAAEELRAACAQAPCDTASYKGALLTRAPEARPVDLLLGRPADLPQRPWWTVLGRHVVMSDEADALRAAIDAWQAGGSLAEEPRAKEWFRQMSDEAGLTWWCDARRGGGLFREGIQEAQAGRSGAIEEFLRGVGAVSVQLSPAPGGMVHALIGLQGTHGDGPARAEPQGDAALWTCAVGAPVMRRPQLVRNHVNGTLEALVQDSLNRLHLIGASGKLLWSRPLDGPILGPAHQVDRFKNGKLQLLLGTARTLYIIDRNGNDVGAPMKLPAPAAAPLAVFDYEGTREYRVVMALDDGRLLNLDLDWAPVQGWSQPRLGTPAAGPVRHLRIAGKDHLQAVEQSGAVRLFDRRGNIREAVRAELPDVRQVIAVEPGQQLGATRIIWTDGSGALHATRLDGTGDDGSLPLAEDRDGDGWPEAVAPEAPERSIPTPLEAVDLPDGRVALGVPDPRTGRAWRFGTAEGAEPLGAGRWAAGDLNLDGRLEAVGADGTGTVTARPLLRP